MDQRDNFLLFHPFLTKPTFTLAKLDDGIQLDFKHFTVVIRFKKNN